MALDPDETCGICGNTRDYHGDANHEFNVDGVLIKKKPPEPPRQNPPRTRDEAAMAADFEHKLVLRLIETLIEKDLLSTTEVFYILGGGKVVLPDQKGTQQT